MLVHECGLLGRRAVEHQALPRRRGCGRGGATGGEQQGKRAERAEGAGDDPAWRTAVPQSSSSPGGRNAKGRSASEMSVEAIQRVRPSKTGAMVEGSSSCCSLKRTEPS